MIYKFKHIALFVSFLMINSLWSVEGKPRMIRACLDPIDSLVTISWNKPTDNCNSFTYFSLYGKEDIFSPFIYLTNKTDYNLNEISIKLKNLKPWSFYLVYNKLCNGIDSVFSDTIIIDKTAPDLTELDSVSVDLTTQKVIIGWSKNNSPDNKGYVVYHYTTTNVTITSVENTSYLDNTLARDPKNSAISYSVAAFDSCNNLSTISTPHRTIFLTQILDNCKKTVSLSWSNYVGWGVGEYQIFLNKNNTNYKLVGTVVSNINQFTYNFTNFGENLCFYIRAKKDNNPLISSSSNIVCLNTTGVLPTKNSYIAKVSVIDVGVEIVCVTEQLKSLEKINIFKQEDNNGFSLWRTENFTGGILRLIDNNTKTSSKNYSYYFSTEGPCNLIFDSSQISKTILLKTKLIDNNNQELKWNNYTSFIKSTENQDVLLTYSPFFVSSTWNILTTTGPNTVVYNDNSTLVTEQLCYCIRAIEVSGTPSFPRKDTSYSNISCITSEPICFFPNAIQLNGFNTEFKPVGYFINKDECLIQIFNRWGELVYETYNFDKAWDGKSYNGELVSEGVYVYKASIKGENGQQLFFSGTITVLK